MVSFVLRMISSYFPICKAGTKLMREIKPRVSQMTPIQVYFVHDSRTTDPGTHFTLGGQGSPPPVNSPPLHLYTGTN